MIHSIFGRVIGYFLILGFVAFIVGPSINWLRGNGFVVSDRWWIELIAVSLVIVITEASRFRRVRRSHFR